MAMTEEERQLMISEEELPKYLYLALLRNGFGSRVNDYGNSSPPLDRERIRTAIADGSIFRCRNIGVRSVITLDAWLENQSGTFLLLCPFCGGAPVFVDRGANMGIHHKPEDSAWDVQCETVGCYAEFGADFWLSQKEIAEMWNRRATAQRMC